jgi:hypothetical protein
MGRPLTAICTTLSLSKYGLAPVVSVSTALGSNNGLWRSLWTARCNAAALSTYTTSDRFASFCGGMVLG